MKPKNLPPISNATPLDIIARIMKLRVTSVFMRLGVILLLAGLVVGSSYLRSVSSNSAKPSLDKQSAVAGNPVSASLASARLGGLPSIRTADMFPLLPLPPAAPTVTVYASDCTTPKTVFNLQDSDKTVCAKVTGAQSSWRILWSNSNFITVQNVPVGSGTSTFTLTGSSSLGDWRVILFDPNGGTVQGVSRFTVIDAANPKADVSVSKGMISGSLSAGGQVIFAVQVDNAGPDAAAAVTLSDNIPANTSFTSFDQLSGPVFTCTNPTAGATSGSTSCTIASFARGESATFVATYQIGGVSSGTVISNTASASSTTSDPSPDNNSATAEGTVAGSPCMLSTPDNITVDADAGQAGAVVTYATPSHSGDCGTETTVTGEDGQPITIPVISCNPTSGSFFGVGSTTVICVAQSGDAVTFQVTVNNPGGLSISLNGASSVTVECGDDFNDPGATAVNGTGQSVPVTVAYTPAFNQDAPAVGTYTATYTATEDPNSVSTTRTITVSDNEAPTITVDGANPYRIATGSCSPFVDPGVSANDGCAGAKPVTTSISGPGGATSVNPAVAGTYTVTYTATDGTHSATATRTVLVGNFSQDEVDQPATSNTPPTVTLNGADEISIECGTPFTDPGATATVCGGSLPVTTTGTVDIHTPGVYSITYSATANGFTTTATRTVTVEADNTAPTITLNGANPMTVECHTSFTDPGAVAHDACAGDFPATASGTVNPNVVGTYTITYNASDPSGHAAAPVTRIVNVVDTTKPVVTAPANVTVNTGSGNTSCTVVVSNATLGTASAADSCQGSLSTTRTGVPAGNIFPAGTTTITYSATDAAGNTGTATQTVTVIDNTVPTITLNGQAHSMWPPNHKYQNFTVSNFVTSASDNCDPTVSLSKVVIEKVTSDEIENGNGDGNTTNDIVISADCKSVQLRSEREGDGNGRVYTITFRVRDASGNTTRATATVVVPHNPGETAVDSGVHYTVNGSCP
jgi:uncharacterized repeat protein (TIGR01451 family)